MPPIIRPVSPAELDIVISDLVELLRETVNGGSSLGFIPPLAHEGGRPLLFLNTRHRGPADGFYKDLGYREIGVILGYAAGPTGERYADVALYQELSL